MLGRIRIIGKLGLLVLVPLVGVVTLTVPIVVNRIDVASRAGDTAEAVRLARLTSSAVQELQEESMLSVGYLFGMVQRPELVVQTARTNEALSRLVGQPDVPASRALTEAVERVDGLDGLRSAVLTRTARPDKIIDGFGALVPPMIDALDLVRHADMATSAGRQVVALDALLRNDDAISRAACYLVAAVGAGAPELTLRVMQLLTTAEADLRRVTSYATPEQAELYLRVQNSFNVRVGPDFFLLLATDPARAVTTLSLPTVFPSLSSVIVLSRFVENRVAVDVSAAVAEQQNQATRTAYTVSTVTLLLLVVVAILSLAMTRSVARPLRRLTASADQVARAAEEELQRVADDDSYAVGTIRFDPLGVSSSDEIGDLARAFDRVQSTAVRLVERQVASRRNVAQMFGHVGRRTQNLVGRQLALIDQLEREETDTERLRQLYRLDHMSSRLRRNASSLVVLSGADGADEHTTPLPLADVVRLALAEIEDYTRVDVVVPVEVRVVPALIGDLTLVLAELMENATVFSPPHSDVTVTADWAEHGARLSVVDHGLGLTDERLAEENARLNRRERLDLVPTEVLGLFVVGRLARRHGLVVSLSRTHGGGLTANVDLFVEHLSAGPPELLPAGSALPHRVAAAAPTPVPGAVQPEQRTGPTPTRPVAPTPGAVATTGGGRELPAPPTGPARSPFDLALLTRATRTIEVTNPWNAFASMGPPPFGQAPAVPARLAPPPPFAGGFETRPSRAGTPPVPDPPPPARPAPARESRGGLTRRVPGATLTDVMPSPAAPSSPYRTDPRLDPDEARSLVEQFEFGIARALSHAQSP